MRMIICLQIPTTFWIDARITSLSYIGSVMLVPEPDPFEVEMATAKLKKGINYNALIKFRQNWFKQEVKHHFLRSINSLIIFRIRKNYLSSGRSHSFYLYTGKVIKLTVPRRITVINFIQNFIQHVTLRVDSICRRNYWESTVWVST
jgi:hypothetical protein